MNKGENKQQGIERSLHLFLGPICSADHNFPVVVHHHTQIREDHRGICRIEFEIQSSLSDGHFRWFLRETHEDNLLDQHIVLESVGGAQDIAGFKAIVLEGDCLPGKRSLLVLKAEPIIRIDISGRFTLFYRRIHLAKFAHEKEKKQTKTNGN